MNLRKPHPHQVAACEPTHACRPTAANAYADLLPEFQLRAVVRGAKTSRPVSPARMPARHLPVCHGWDLAYVCLDRPLIGRRLESLALWGAHPQTSPRIGPAAGRCAMRGRSLPLEMQVRLFLRTFYCLYI